MPPQGASGWALLRGSWIRVQGGGPQAETAIRHRGMCWEYTRAETEAQGLCGGGSALIQAIAGRARMMLLYAEDYTSHLQDLSAGCFGLHFYDTWGPRNSVTAR